MDALGISDHQLIYVAMRSDRAKNTARHLLSRNLRSIQSCDIDLELSRIDWSPLFGATHVDGMVTYFTTSLMTIFDRLAPLTARRISRPPAPWLNTAVRSLIKLKRRALLKFKPTRSPMDWKSYRSLRND
ncbi:PREDICTED: uncharacterized protein LOC105556860, partial [Vollenhovia emeryi]|uniref:uncharacterized protein LOC105556860 n=1 Tax=Vollenhovia emeryi TaxID=411798 RepID=UPI0005F3E3B6